MFIVEYYYALLLLFQWRVRGENDETQFLVNFELMMPSVSSQGCITMVQTMKRIERLEWTENAVENTA